MKRITCSKTVKKGNEIDHHVLQTFGITELSSWKES